MLSPDRCGRGGACWRHTGVCVCVCMQVLPCPSIDKLLGSLEMKLLISGQMFHFDRCRAGALWVMESVTNYNLGKLKKHCPFRVDIHPPDFLSSSCSSAAIPCILIGTQTTHILHSPSPFIKANFESPGDDYGDPS